MKLKLEQLSKHLEVSLAPIYLVAGDEILLKQNACDAIRKKVLEKGFSDRQTFYIEPGFDENILQNILHHSSLFSKKQLIELHLSTKKFSSALKALFETAFGHPEPSKCFIIHSKKLDAGTQKNAWFKAIEKNGIFIPIWPIKAHELPRWIGQRLKQAGFQTNTSALRYLAEATEGNLLAAQQEIEKLKLLYQSGKLDEKDVKAAMTDSTRFDVFALADSALSGNIKRTTNILTHLKTESVQTTLILWSLTKEIRVLLKMIDKVPVPVWDSRKGLYQACLKRVNQKKLYSLLQKANTADQIIKGVRPGNLWDELLDICVGMA